LEASAAAIRKIVNEQAALTPPAMDMTPELPATTAALLDQLLHDTSVLRGEEIDLTGKSMKIDTLSVHTAFSVLGSSTFGETTIAGGALIDATVKIDKSGIQTIAETLYLQKTKLGSLDLLAGTMIIDTSGNVRVTGNLAVSGNVTVGGVLGADTIQTNSGDITLSLEKPSSGSATFGSLLVKGAGNEPVVSISSTGNANFAGNISASGSATVKKLNINQTLDIASSQSGQIATSSSTIGSTILPAHQSEVSIPSTEITDHSLIYVTPLSSTGNQVLYVVRKESGQSFTVAVDAPLDRDIKFNWWIVN
jgi:hypothetical protein